MNASVISGGPLTPRDYQEEAIQSPERYWAEGNFGFPLTVAPTGAGKSLIIAEFCKRAVMRYPNTRILVLAHVKELIEQNSAELIGQWPSAPMGIYAASLKKKDLGPQIVFAMIQSIIRVADRMPRWDLVIVDEAHLIAPSSNTMYRKLIDAVTAANPAAKLWGLTATPFRMSTGMLHTGKDALFTDICYEIPIGLLVDERHLAPVTTRGSKHKINLENVKKQAGDFKEKDLQAAIDDDDTFMSDAIAEIEKHGEKRKKWIIFCISVEHSEDVANQLNELGYPSKSVHSKMAAGERTERIAAHKNGDLRCLTSVGVLTTGFNSPKTDLVVFLRPTMSPGLYVQMVGRGMRTAVGKTDCLVLDFAGNVERHGPIDLLTIEDKTPGQGEAPAKECPQCQLVVPTGTRFCPECGYEFEFKTIEEKLEKKATNNAIMARDLEPIIAAVDRVSYSNTQKSLVGKTDSMRVDYYCGFQTFTEWVTIEHSGEAYNRARHWFIARGLEPPTTTDAAIALAKAMAPRVTQIQVRKGKPFDRIESWTFADDS